MSTHVTILGVLYAAFSVIGLLIAGVVFFVLVGGGLLSGDAQAMMITSGLGAVIGGFLAILAIPGLIGGIGLLRRRSWARVLVLILGVVNLINIPFGTLLAIYTFWVLLNAETVQFLAGQEESVPLQSTYPA